MSASPAAANPARSTRGRRAARASGDDRERAILETAERLMEERSLQEISVDDLARGAGLSRSAFYFYFPSKDAVVLTLVDRMVEEAGRARDAAAERVLAADPIAAWRESLQALYASFGAHRGVIRAAAELSPTNPEACALRSQNIEGWVDYLTERIERERCRGAAPQTIPTRDLATALVHMIERALSAVFVDETPAVAEDRVIDTLNYICLGAIYGTVAPGG